LYAAVRDNLATLLAEASELGRGLPRYVERDFARYLECGVLTHGFARVRCESCKDELLVAFSCKGRGVCPSCNAKRAHVTAAHLVERVLPHVPYRQWTLSFPHRVRWVLLKDAGLLSDVLTVFLRAVFALQRRRARRQGIRRGQVGAVSFIQFFGSALQVTPHFLQQRLRWTEVDVRPPFQKAAPVRLAGGLLPACQYASACQRQTGLAPVTWTGSEMAKVESDDS
jgi:hypothetical protein